MKSKAEKKVQVRNAFLASVVSIVISAGAALVAGFVLKLGVLCSILVFAIVFALTLAALIYVWKTTDLIRKILYLLYCIKHPAKSRRFYCSCCNRTLEGFIELGYSKDSERFDSKRFMKQKQDVICPFCYSAPRQRIQAVWLDANMSTVKDSRILCFAPEYSMMKWFRRNGIKVTTADLFDSKAELKLDITNIDLPDESYDVVICNHVLEHVSSYENALTELNRILVDKGLLIVSFPLDEGLDTVFEQEASTPEYRIRLFGQVDHVRIFGRDSAEILTSFGFDVQAINISEMPENILPVVGPADYDSNQIYICRKVLNE